MRRIIAVEVLIEVVVVVVRMRAPVLEGVVKEMSLLIVPVVRVIEDLVSPGCAHPLVVALENHLLASRI